MAFAYKLKRLKRDKVVSYDLAWNDHLLLEQENVTLEKWTYPARRLNTTSFI